MDEERGCIEYYRGAPPGERANLDCDWPADASIYAVDEDGTCWTLTDYCHGIEEWGWRFRTTEDTHCIGMDSGAFPDCDELDD